MLANVRFFRFPAPTVPDFTCFQAAWSLSFANRPLTLGPGSSVLFRPFFRVPSPSWLPSSFDSSVPAQGFGPLRDFTCVRPQFVRFPNPSLRSARRFSQPFDGLLRTLASWAYSIPLPRSGFLFPFRGLSPLAQPYFLVESLLPPCRFSSNQL